MATTIMPAVSIDVNMFWQIINFFILVFVFNKYFKKPLGKMLETRKAKIISDLSDANANKEAAMKLQKEAEGILKKAKFQANEILKTAEHKADKRRENILSEAKDQRDKIIKNAELEAVKMKSDVRKELQDEVKDLAVRLAEKLIEEKINPKLESTLIDEFIEEVGEER